MDLYAHAMRDADTDASEKVGEVIPRRAQQAYLDAGWVSSWVSKD
jgi:hypothetical protein